MTVNLLIEHHLEFLSLKGGLHILVWVYTCQDATLLKIACRGSYKVKIFAYRYAYSIKISGIFLGLIWGRIGAPFQFKNEQKDPKMVGFLTLTIFFTMMAYIFLVIIIYVLLPYVCIYVI